MNQISQEEKPYYNIEKLLDRLGNFGVKVVGRKEYNFRIGRYPIGEDFAAEGQIGQDSWHLGMKKRKELCDEIEDAINRADITEDWKERYFKCFIDRKNEEVRKCKSLLVS